MARSLFPLFFCLASFADAWERTSVPEDFVMPKPMPFDQSIASVKAAHGLKVQLIAAEPQVKDPVAIDFGPDGKLWVVEMADYPLGMDGKNKPGGRVRFLEDKDGDGHYETSTLFLDELNFPTGVKVWRDGILIIACPEIILAKDTDGDGKADFREVLYHGFKEGNQQHRVNGFTWGLDNWLHLANGDSGGTITSNQTGETLELGSFDLKIRPDTGEMKLTAGRTQYGRVRDDYGNWFGNNNSKPLWQYALPKEITDLNPHIIYANRIHQVPEQPSAPRIFPTSKTAHRFNNPNSASHITSACGISIIRDSAISSDYYGNALICEPVHNLVHRQVLEPDGIIFNGKRAKQEAQSEFLTSTDQWFRPVFSTTGPHGGLWIVDMHRYVIEHPEWIPEPWQKVLNLRAGEDKGRIYRITSEADKPSTHDLQELPIAQLIPLLDSTNGWQRDIAHQLILWNPKGDLVGFYDDLSTPLGNIHFLSIVKARSGNVPGILLYESLTSDSPQLQRFALLLVNADNANPAVIGEIEKLAKTQDKALRFHAIIALGQLNTTGDFLASLIPQLDPKSYDLAAIGTTLPRHLTAIAKTFDQASNALWLPDFIETAIGTGNLAVITQLLKTGHPETIYNLLSVLERRRMPYQKFIANSSPELVNELTKQLTTARQKIDAKSLSKKQILLLGNIKEQRSGDVELLNSQINTSTPLHLISPVVEKLIQLNNYTFLTKWNQVSPAIQAVFIEKGVGRKDFCETFLNQVETGSIPRPTISVTSKDRLVNHRLEPIKTRAAKLFGQTNPDRQTVIDKFTDCLTIDGEPENGKLIFQQLCIACHQFKGQGNAIGADLSALAAPTPDTLLTAILDPNRAVEDKYLLYSLTLNDGTNLAGMINNETASTIEWQSMDGSVRQIPRNQIKSILNTGRSAMLEGLEGALDHQKMADLLAYLLAKN